MDKQCWNWARILGNTISAFCISAVGINLAGGPEALVGAFYIAIITAGLAFAKELQEEGKEEPSKLSHLLVF